MRALAIGVLLLALAGCAGEPPQKELDEAKSAIDAALAAGADKYAAEEYSGATATLQKARGSVAERDYRQALSYAIDARQRAIEASHLVPDGRARAKAAAEAELKQTTESVARLTAAMRAVPDTKGPTQELRAPRETLDAAQSVLQETRTALGARKFAEANALLNGVREKVDLAAQQVELIPQRAKPAKGRKH